jgi:hypothetical protein
MVSVEKRQAIQTLLADGLDNQQISSQIGVSPQTVAAVKAHITMGTYGTASDGPDAEAGRVHGARSRRSTSRTNSSPSSIRLSLHL